MRNGLVVGLVPVAIGGAFGAVIFTGPGFQAANIGLPVAVIVGLTVGGIAAVAFVTMGLLVMPIGICMGGKQGWVSLGTWLIVIPVAAAIVMVALLLQALTQPA